MEIDSRTKFVEFDHRECIHYMKAFPLNIIPNSLVFRMLKNIQRIAQIAFQ